MKPSGIVSFLAVSTSLHFFFACGENCGPGECCFPFTSAPAALQSSPLNCNIRGGTVRLQCRIETPGGVQIIWYFTKERSAAGNSAAGQKLMAPTCGSAVICTNSETGSSDVVSTLTISPFNNTEHSGFYWCERTPVQGATSCAILPTANTGSCSILPSLIVNIQANFTLDELNTCSSDLKLDFFNLSTECAYGNFDLRQKNIVEGVEFINYTIVTQTITENITTVTMPMDIMSNESNVTTATTELDIATMLVEDTEAPGGGSSNVVRTAIIWFSVGAVVLVMIVIAIILCAVAISKN